MELKPSDEEQKDGAILNCSRVKVRKTRVRVTHEYKEIKNIKNVNIQKLIILSPWASSASKLNISPKTLWMLLLWGVVKKSKL